MDWFFRILTIVVMLCFAAMVSLGLSAIIFDYLVGMGVVRLMVAASPILIALYASFHVIMSCLFDGHAESFSDSSDS